MTIEHHDFPDDRHPAGKRTPRAAARRRSTTVASFMSTVLAARPRMSLAPAESAPLMRGSSFRRQAVPLIEALHDPQVVALQPILTTLLADWTVVASRRTEVIPHTNSVAWPSSDALLTGIVLCQRRPHVHAGPLGIR